MGFILRRRRDFFFQKWARDCKLLPGETVTTQHRPIVADMWVVGRREIQNKGKMKIKWRNLEKEEMIELKTKILQGLDTTK